MMPLHPPGKNITQTLEEDREAVILADRLGFSEAYVGEHVTDAAETVTSSMIFLASLITETKNIMLGTGTINVPNSHPAAIAAQAERHRLTDVDGQRQMDVGEPRRDMKGRVTRRSDAAVPC